MASPTDDERRHQWDKQGFVVFEDAITGDDLQRLQTSFDRCAAEAKDGWLEAVARGNASPTYFDISNPFARDEWFVNLVDHPTYFPHLKAFADGDALFLGPQFRTVPPWPIAYTGWHPDVGHTAPLHMKVQIYVNDVPPRSGEFGYVPGSHKQDAGPFPRVIHSESMPGHRAFPAKAGTAILFNSYGWHTAMDNHTKTARKSIILIYEKRFEDRVNRDKFASVSNLCTTTERRRLFGLE